MIWHVRNVAAFLVVLAAAALAIAGLAPPDVVPASSSPARFSGERAMAYVRQIATTPHPTGSPAQVRVEEYITAELSRLGLWPDVTKRSAVETRNGRAIVGTVRDIAARRRGTGRDGQRSSGAILLCAHYDSQIDTPGAGDDSSGVAVLLETARALAEGPALANDVVFLFTDSEETGLLGARAFMHLPLMNDVRVVLNFEARGNRGPSLMFQTGPGNRWLIEQLSHAVSQPRAGSLFYEVYRRLPNDTDFTVFSQAGIPGYNFAFIGGLAHYHARTDTPERIDPRSIQHHGDQAVELVRHLGQLDLARMPARTDTRDAVYFNTFGDHFVAYPASWSLPLCLALIALWGFLVFQTVRRQGPSWTGSAMRTGLAAIAFPVILAMSGLCGWLVLRVLAVFHPEWQQSTSGGIHDSPFVFAAIAATVWLAASSLFGFLARKLGGTETTLATQAWLLALLVFALIAAPTATYLLLVPLAGVVLGLVIESFLPRPENSPGARPRATWPLVRAVFALPAIALFCPAIYLFFEALSIDLVFPQAMCITFLAGLLLPWLDAIDRYQRRAMLVLAGAAALVLFIRAGFLSPDPDAEHPAQSHLLYYADADAEQAAWVSSVDRTDAFTEPLLGKKAAASQLTIVPTIRAARVAQAPFQPAGELPTLRAITPWISSGEAYKLSLRLAVPPEALAADILLPTSIELRKATIEQLTVEAPFYKTSGPYHIIHVFAPNRYPLIMELTVARKAAIPMIVVTKRPGLPQLPELASMPTSLIPAASGSLFWPYTTYIKKQYNLEPLAAEDGAAEDGAPDDGAPSAD